GLKQKDLQPCALCGNGVMHNNNITFYRISIEHLVIDTSAVSRQHGMEMMMGQVAPLAQVMGPDEDIAKIVLSWNPILICQSCALGEHGIGAVLSAIEH
ncbi:hypothetical protein LCGC14_1834170, partial [marine sediment metagenome]